MTEERLITRITARLTVQTVERLRVWARLAGCRHSTVIEQALLEWMEAQPDELAIVDRAILQAQQIREAMPAPDTAAPATPPRKYSRIQPDEVRHMQELALTGMTCPQIAEIVGRPYSTVLDVLHREGHLPKDARRTADAGKDE